MKNIRVFVCCVILLSILALSLINGCSNNTEKTVSGRADTGDLYTIKKKIQELNNKKLSLSNELAATQNKYVSFTVQGEIIGSRSSSEIHIFGTAMPSNNDWSHAGVVSQKGNITIREPRKKNILPSHYTDFEVYYVGATTGKNLFGVSVPVHIYTTEAPSNIDKLKGKIADIDGDIDKLKQEYATVYTKWKENLFSSIKDNPTELIKYGNVFLDKKDYEAATRAFKRLVELNRNDADAHVYLGYIYQNQNNIDEAIAEYKVALTINPQHITANRNLGLALLNYKRDKIEAAKIFREYLKIAKSDDPDYILIKEKLDDIGGTEESWQKRATNLRQEIQILKTQLAGAERYGSRSRIDHYSEKLNIKKRDYEEFLNTAEMWGFNKTTLKTDFKDAKYYQKLTEEANILQQEIESYKWVMKPKEHDIEKAKKGGYYNRFPQFKEFERDLSKYQQLITIVQQRIQEIEKELSLKNK